MKKIRYHIIFWTCYFLYCYLSDLIIDDTTTLGNELFLFLTHNIFLFYTLIYFFNTFSKRTRKELIVSIVRLIVIILAFYALRFFGRYYILTKYFDPGFSSMTYDRCFAIGATWVVQYFFFSSAYFYFRTSIQKQKDLTLAIQEKLVEQKEKLELENTLLKAQINPHFLYNTLNFLYAKSLPLSSDLSNAIMKLSEIMRHSMQPHDKEGLVQLDEEIEHIQNLIEMARLRFNNQIFINLSVKGDFEHLRIIPFALITLVENVMKHGLVNVESKPANILIEFTPQDQLHFTTWNYKRMGPKENSTSIGLANTRKRLANKYGDDCSFEIVNESELYKTDLYISINKLKPTSE